MGKKANVTENIQQKLSLVVKSGKFRIGKSVRTLTLS